MDGWRDRIRSKVRGQDTGGGGGDSVTTNLLQFTDTKEKEERKGKGRTVAILTCKSIVGAGYRGERLIEPSSSWFLPKFPSG